MKSKLTESEIKLCRATGAKWLSKNGDNYGQIQLWSDKPVRGPYGPTHFFSPDTKVSGCCIGSLNEELFPSIEPGDCVKVEEALSVAEKAAAHTGLESTEIENRSRLTDPERAICKAVGAKWITRDSDEKTAFAILWADKPKKGACVYMGGGFIAKVCPDRFPSLEPGDCVSVEED